MASQPFIDIPLGPFLPDFGGRPNPANPGYLVDCVNLRPTPSGYRGTLTFTNVGTSIATLTTRGTTFVAIRADTQYIFISADNAIYQSNNSGNSWSNVATITDENCDIAQFDDYVIVCELSVAPKYKTITTSQATAFGTLPDSPPQGSTVARIRDHIVIGRTSADPYSVQWCAIGDPTDWPTPNTSEALAKEAGSQRLPSELGIVTKVVGGEDFGLVFQERGITRMTYVGGNVVYEFDTFEKTVGIPQFQSPAAIPPITKVGDVYYFGCPYGFYVTDGYKVRQVSSGAIQDSVILGATGHPDYSSRLAALSSTCYDPAKNMLLMQWGSSYFIGYNPELGQFFPMDGGTSGVLLPTPVYNEPGASAVGIFRIYSTGYLQALTAANADIALQTGYIEIDPGYRVQLQGAHLIGAGVPGSLTLGYKGTSDYDNIDIVQTGFTNLTAQSLGNKATGRANNQFFSFRATGTGAESQLISGIRVYFERGEPA
jgi:hypothetical protein